MSTYFSNGAVLEVRIPTQFDPTLVKNTIDELVAWEGAYPSVADVQTLEIAIAHAKTPKALERLRELVQRDPVLAIAFLRLCPEKSWAKVTSEYTNATFAMAIARGIADKRKCSSGAKGVAEPRLDADLVHATNDELRAIFAALLTKAVTSVWFDEAQVASRIATLIADRDQLITVWKKTARPTLRRLLMAVSDGFLIELEQYERQRTDRSDHDLVVFEAMRRGLVDAARFAAILEAAAKRPNSDKLTKLVAVPRTNDLAGWSPEDIIRAIGSAHRHAAPLATLLRAYVREHRDELRTASDVISGSAMFALAVIYDADAAAWFAATANGHKEWFRKGPEAAWLAERLGDLLSAREDGEQLVDDVAGRFKGKLLGDVIADARARLANHRVMLGVAGDVTIQWARTTRTDALRLLKTASDPRDVVEAGLAGADPVGVLNAFVTAYELVARPLGQRDGTLDVWTYDFLATALRRLETTYGPDAPDGKALANRIDHWNAKNAFLDAFEYFYELDTPGSAARARFDREVLAPLYAATKNVRFRNWIEKAALRGTSGSIATNDG